MDVVLERSSGYSCPSSAASPSMSIGLEVQRAHVVEHQRRRAKTGLRRTYCGQPLPPRVLGIRGQTPFDRRIRWWADPGLFENPQ